MRTLVFFVFLSALTGCVTMQSREHPRQSSLILFDVSRQRPIQVEIYLPARASRCTSAHPCPVALISAGYGISHKSYAFIASSLNQLGCLAVAVQQELPSDPPLATDVDLFAARTPNWQRGAENLRFVLKSMRESHPGFNWRQPVLIGHSNGGDISAWLVRESPMFAGILVTLDNRRVPLPRASSTRVLSIRASDFQADAGVLPTGEELKASGACIVKISDARHNDMHDGGPIGLKHTITRYIVKFLDSGICNAALPIDSQKKT